MKQLTLFTFFSIGLLSLTIDNSCYAMQAQQQRWKGRIVPIASIDSVDHVLLRKSPGGYWEDFYTAADHGERGNAAALRALEAGTNYQYSNLQTADFRGQPAYQTPTKDWVHFFRVNFIPGRTLYTAAHNKDR